MMRNRILVSAYGCEPEKGSEQGVGWNWVLQLARIANLVVVTRRNNKTAIEAALPAELTERVLFKYHDAPGIIRSLKRKEKGLYPYYLAWQWGAYRLARQLSREQSFDYVMHLTFGSVWMPTFMHRLPLPFIWGPVGGGEAVPFHLISSLPARSRFVQYLRYCLMATFSFNPLYTRVARRAQIILTRTPDTANLIPTKYIHKVRVMLETAVADDWLEMCPAYERESLCDQPVKAIYTGRLVAIKNVSVAIKAVAAARRMGVNIQLSIVGEGPLRDSLRALAVKEEIADSVVFTGLISQSEVLMALRESDIYVLPSLKEGGVWSLMEAMALGLAVVCVNTSGMAVIADSKSAVLVEPRSQQQMTDDFTLALQELAQSPELRQQMGVQARKRIESKFRWQHKGVFMADLLKELEQKEL